MAVKALAATVTVVLSDDANRHLARRRHPPPGEANSDASVSAVGGDDEFDDDESFMSPEVLAAQLQRMASKGKGNNGKHDSIDDAAGVSDEEGDPSPSPLPPPEDGDTSAAHLKITRTRSWQGLSTHSCHVVNLI